MKLSERLTVLKAQGWDLLMQLEKNDKAIEQTQMAIEIARKMQEEKATCETSKVD